MGYYINVGVGSIVILEKDVESALEAINDLMLTGQQFSWVNGPRNVIEGYRSLHEALEDWRFDSGYDLNGNFAIKNFTGEKLGHDEELFEVIAPFIVSQPLAQIIYSGEDGEKWRYRFHDGTFTKEDSVFKSDCAPEQYAQDVVTERLVKAQQHTIEAATQRLKLISSLSANAKGGSIATMHQALETIEMISTDLDKEVEIMPTQIVGDIRPVGAPVATIAPIKK